jgi:type 1 glutamine amidotransferase
MPNRAFLLLPLALSLLAGRAVPAAERRLLVYTRNHVSSGQGYVHACIPDGVEAIRRIARQEGIDVEVSDDPAVFTDAALRRFRAVVFANSNNEAFSSDAQREAFLRFSTSGGGFVGIHSASGSERTWPPYWALLGGKFQRHAVIQRFTVTVTDANHEATRGLPASFEWDDECYMLEYLNPDLHPLLSTDVTRLRDARLDLRGAGLLGKQLPLAWTITTGGRRSFYTALGHRKEHYSNPILVRHLRGGILWAMGEDGPAAR